MSKEVEEAIKIIKEQKEDAEHGIKYMECTPEDYDEDIYNSYIETKKKAETVLNYIKELEETLKCTQNSWYNDTEKIQELEEEKEIYKNELKKIDKALNVKVGTAMPTSSDIIESMKKSVTQYKMIVENSIPKSKIRDKIEEYKKRKENCNDIEAEIRLDVKIRAYEELLEEE